MSGSTGWNREHTFPQSKMATSASRSDDHIVFASDNKVNGARSNYVLGLVNHSGASPVVDSYGYTTECYRVGSVFEPCDAARGEVARASLYASTLYDYDVADNFTSAALCYDWNKNHPITDREMKRNNVLYTLQHNRNPFTDHPEFATMIWDASYNGSGALNDRAI